MEKKHLNFFILLFVFSILFIVPGISYAANLGFSPSTLSRTAGSTFSVAVYVSSPNKAMNAASGVVSFPWDKLEVISISKQGSIFSLWPVEPSFSNSQGTVSFEGIVPNPGYTGANGKILTITFKTRSAGVANVSFSSGSVLANDGTGTNILDGLRVAVYTLTSTTVPTPVSQSEAPIVSGNALNITSATHPDQEKWYVSNGPEFSWTLPDGALEVRTLIDKSSSRIPSVSYIPSISKKKVDELLDGTYYFTVQVRTASGWSPVSRYRVNIDTTPPKPFSITFPHGSKGWNPQPIVLFNTADSESGISHYEIKIGAEDKSVRNAPQTDSSPYALPVRTPGDYTLLVTAVDKAGNVRTSSSEYSIEGIDPPVITYYTESMEEGDILKIRGTTYPDSDVNVYIREGDTLVLEEHTRSNSLGDFALVVAKRLGTGVYTFTVWIKDGRGAQSAESSPFTVSIQSEFVSDIVSFILKYLSAVILIILALATLVGCGAYVWYRSLGVVRRLRRESREAEKVLEKSFNLLRKDLQEHITRLKAAKSKRKLSSEELAFLERFEEELSEAKDIIAKEIQDISHS